MIIEKNLNFKNNVYGDVCQRSNNITIPDADIENFENEILEALNNLEDNVE